MEIIKHSKETDLYISALDKLNECEELAKVTICRMYEPEQIESELAEIESICSNLRTYIRELLIGNMYNNLKHGIELA